MLRGKIITKKKLLAAKKAFSSPDNYRKALLSSNLIRGDFSQLTGKSFICVSFTRFCPVGCKFCFFKSGPLFKKPSHEDIMIPEGIDKFIAFANSVNLGYLLVSGGGEPMMEKRSVLQVIEHVNSERIVLVTSAHWAKSIDSASRYLEAIETSLKKRTSETLVTIRVSVDSEHLATLTLAPIVNLINLFYQKYSNVPQLELQIHSIKEDAAIDELLNQLSATYNINREQVNEERISDGKNAVKIVPQQEIISFNNYRIKVGYAKIFYSNLRVNIKDHDLLERNIEVYQKDLLESEDGNSSIATNKLGNPGLDFWVNYNGNVTTWGNQFLDNLFNLYVDDAEKVITGTLSDPAALAFIEKGAIYRDRVLSEANEISVNRSKAVNIRDYTGALMFDEGRSRLYFTIRSMQDYIKEGRVSSGAFNSLPEELKDLLSLDKSALIDAYNSDDTYTIVDEVIAKTFDKDFVLDILEWIKLGHYKLSDQKIQKLINYYNSKVSEEDKLSDINQLDHNLKMQVVRMREHLTHIKPEALKLKTETLIAS
jgi:organic radical activating enzyme